MAFIRAKQRRGKDGRVLTYYQLVENRRERGRVRQHVLAYPGTHPTLAALIAAEEEELRQWEAQAEQAKQEVERLRRGEPCGCRSCRWGRPSAHAYLLEIQQAGVKRQREKLEGLQALQTNTDTEM